MLDLCGFPVDRFDGIEIRRPRLTAASLLRWSSSKAEDSEIFSQSSNISWEELNRDQFAFEVLSKRHICKAVGSTEVENPVLECVLC